VDTMLFHAHSGLRYLVLLAAVVALLVLLHGKLTRRPWGSPARISGAVFMGLLDVQVVLGLVLLAVWTFHPMLIGHIVMMIAAVVIAHGARVAARKAPTDEARYNRSLLSVVIPLLLIAGGILAIGRSIV
jgi:hypothetical protein